MRVANAETDDNIEEPDAGENVESARPSDFRLTTAEVIVVDDDAAVRKRLRDTLEWAGYTVRIAASGEQALALLGARFCPLLLTDAAMPGMSGLELCRALRASPFERYVYTIVLSVRDGSDDVLKGLAAGADDYVSKRAPKFEILARLRTGRRIVAMAEALRAMAATARERVYHDPLTMTFNRRYLTEGLSREIDRARRYRHCLSLLACELGGLPARTDKAGAARNDELLQEFVGRLRSVLRDGCDWIARCGPEQFVVVLPETAVEGACRVAEKILRFFAETPLDDPASTPQLAVNIGVTGARSATLRRFSSAEHLLNFAERSLLRSCAMGPGRYSASSYDPRDIKSAAHSPTATESQRAATATERAPEASVDL